MVDQIGARSIGSNFNLGGEQAEADPLLLQSFYQSGQYGQISSQEEHHCFLVGRTGSGKSAMLRRLEEKSLDHVIRINPEDLSLPYIAQLGGVKYLSELDVQLDPYFIALWKHVLLIEIIRHRYKIDSAAAKQNFLITLKEKIVRDKSKQVALEYLEEFEGKFWCETDERVRDITDKFESQITSAAAGSIGTTQAGIHLGGGNKTTRVTEETVQLQRRFQRIVNDAQLPRLNKMIKVLDEDILDSDQNYTYVVIDDLDRDWVDDKIANDLIRCLFRAVTDLIRVQNLKVIVALRTNIFELLDFGNKTGGQEEKFRSLVLRIRWTKSELKQLLNERVIAAARKYCLAGISGVDDLLPAANATRGSAVTYVMERTLMRPRDAIAFLNECLSLASGKSRLSWSEIHTAERAYSTNRLLALRDEWKPSYPDIGRVFQLFVGSPSRMAKDALTRRLDDAILLPADPDFEGATWMNKLGEPVWSGTGKSWAEMYQPIVKLLYSIGFIGFRRKTMTIYAHDEADLADSISSLDETDCFAVHPAFGAALDIEEVSARR